MKTNELFGALVASALLFSQTPRAMAAERVGQARPDTILLDKGGSEKGFKTIFNGKDLSGWEGNPKLWSVKEGAITGQTTSNTPAKGNTFLIWKNGSVSDFELRCSFKIVPGDDKGFGNSGIQYRSKVLDPGNWVVGGYQADMEAGTKYTGILYEERMTRGIMAERGEKVVWNKECKKEVVGSLGTSEELQRAIKQRDWNDYVVVAKGNHLQHFINGKQTVDVTDDCEEKRAMSGVLALQLHAGPPMTVQFRNLRIKTLAAEAATTKDDDLKKLQGNWTVGSIEGEGSAEARDQLGNITLMIKDRTYKVAGVDGENSGSFSIDPSKQPKQMDIDAGGDTMQAIYEAGEDSFRVCYGLAGAPRPASFSTKEDPRFLLITYKRKKAE